MHGFLNRVGWCGDLQSLTAPLESLVTSREAKLCHASHKTESMKADVEPQLKRLLADAAAHWQRGDRDQAERILQDAADQHMASAVAQHAIGLFRFQLGQLDPASKLVARAAVLDPGNAAYQRDLAEMLRRLGELDKALACAIAGTRLAPKNVDGLYNLALIYADLKQPDNAAKYYRRALKLQPTHGLSWNNLGSILEHQDDLDGAEKAYRRAIALDARHAEAQNNLGALLIGRGGLEEAKQRFELAIGARAEFAQAHYNVSTHKTYRREDAHLAELRAMAPKRAGLDLDARIQYCFALAKALDDVGDYDDAFAAYAEGNLLESRRHPCNESGADHRVDEICRVMDRSFFESRRDARPRVDARTPIFIVGMPRSGTSLLEQILATHPSVYGAGELPDFDLVTRLALDPVVSYARGVAALDGNAVDALGRTYLDRVWKQSPKSRYITDKMPANFFHIGLIQLALPGARMIHSMRDPMDSCFSCFSRLFESSMEFANDLETLGRYCARYARVMAHWRSVLPTESFLDLSYEGLIQDTEIQARRVTDFIGLPWDPACLEFHRNKRVVATASVAQVRKPIYHSSVGRWKQFAPHLGPLWKHVAPFRGSTDVAPPMLQQLEANASAARPASSLLEQQNAEGYYLEGLSMSRQGRIEDALRFYDKALALRPQWDMALNARGYVQQELGAIEAAIATLEHCVQLAPGNAPARLNLGMAQLKLARFDAGWENYEARWTGSAESAAGTLSQRMTQVPQWNGEEGTQQLSLLVVTEQGFGDIFQFCRYLDLCRARFARVGFAVSPPALRLMEWSFGDRIAMFVRLPTELQDWDLQCQIMSLPRAFRTRLDNIPDQLPYLRVPVSASSFWQHRIEQHLSRPLRVGIAWAGRKSHQHDAKRSIAFHLLAPLMADQRVAFVSLQKWAADESRPDIPESVEWHDWTDELTDFADSAALIANLDVVISVDSAMVHLAGALGCPVLMLNRFDSEWRWLHRQSTSPWYPFMQIFNQDQRADWSAPIARVAVALAAVPVPPGRSVAHPRKRVLQASAVVSAQPQSVDQLVQLAARDQSAGRLAEAEQSLGAALQQEPIHAQALHLLGVVRYQRGDKKAGIDLVSRAIAVDAKVALFHSNLAEMLRQHGEVALAIEHGQKAVDLDASSAAALTNLGIALYDDDQFDAAEALQKRAMAIAPQSIAALNNLGSIERKRGDRSLAAQWYRKALAVRPDALEALSNLGAVLVEDDFVEEAIPHLEAALRINPNFPEALCNLGLANLGREKFTDAEAAFKRCLQLKPEYTEGLVGLARVMSERERHDEALVLLRRALEIDPRNAEHYLVFGASLDHIGATQSAESAYLRALQLAPKSVSAMVALASHYMERGDMGRAEALLHQALGEEPNHLGAVFQLVQLKKVTPNDALLASLADIGAGEHLGSIKTVSLHYARGKALDDLGRYSEAMEAFVKGAAIKRSMLEHDAAADAARTRHIADVVDQSYLHRLKGSGVASRIPIFVLGMPRSGTTLTEQIIASHSRVLGAGELPHMLAMLQEPYPLHQPHNFPDNLAGLGADNYRHLAERYLAKLPELPPEKAHITDKMPANFMLLGPIALMFPNAKIIHVTRDPVDTCLSCFTRLFAHGQEHSYDLAEIGRFYVSYARLMEHWRAALPGRFLEVRYEDIVSDIELQARRLIGHCDLPWEEACLSFYKTQRSVRTASLTQVRQPIYSSSVERWRHYQKYLGPLFDALGDYAPAR